MIFIDCNGPKITQLVSQFLPRMLIFSSPWNNYSTIIIFCLFAKDRTNKWYFTCKFWVEDFIFSRSSSKNEGSLLLIIKIVEHTNESTARHKWIITCFMTALCFDILLHKLVIYICIRLQQFLIKAGFK